MNAIINLLLQQKFSLQEKLIFDGHHSCWFLFKDMSKLNQVLNKNQLSVDDYLAYVTKQTDSFFNDKFGYLPRSNEIAIGIGLLDQTNLFRLFNMNYYRALIDDDTHS